ncbi:efflux RND transporter permease subunit [Motiliproteus sp. SC1-56]|uniref:efflux RND transporter permease subunit n=1 Tax=Motiliproteus sp. SC1-56 TaxID=2799565 RepID=UPI001A8C22DD|nr:efflux RND transporter permease subunit [Motiliproteus sp. SC1-56]
MVLSDLSIKRPVFATVINLLVLLVGIIAYDRLTVREYPNIDVPVITVETRYPGANAAIMETQVTEVLEDSLSGVEGIDFMTSVSRSETSQITVTFKLDRDADAAASDVRDRVGRVRGRLPDDIDEPVVAKVEADAQPIMYLAFSSDRHNSLDVTDFAERQVKDPLQVVPGVANVQIFGERRYAMRVWLDRTRMAAYNTTVQDIENALRQQNLEVPAGRIESQAREFSILSETDLNSVAEFERIIIRTEDGYPVRLGDVARVEIGPEDERRITRFKGESAVALGVVKQSTANPLDVSSGVRAELPKIQALLPEGMKVAIAYDSSLFIAESIDAVLSTLIQAAGLVVLVIFLFLRNLRATLIPMVTIPVSLVGAFALMYALDFSINTLTLLALVLAIGLVVDDAIVMLENIYRHVESGMDPIQAAFRGSREIAFAVIATTLTLVAVFVPVAFTPGRTGMLFTEFALTLAAAVVVSTFIALSLSPMMCSRLLKHQSKHSALYNLFERGLHGLARGYRWLLTLTLRLRPLMLGLVALSLWGAWVFYQQLPRELAPVEDRGTIIAFSMAPDGASVSFMDRYARQVEKLFASVEEGDRYFMIVGFPSSTQSIGFLGLKPWEQRERSQQSIAQELMPKMYGGITGTMSFPLNPPSLGQSIVNRPVSFVIQSTSSYQELSAITDQVMAKVYQSGLFVQPDSNLKLNKPELRVAMRRDKVADVGTRVETIGRTLETLMAGREVTRFKREGEQYNVVLQVEDVDRSNPEDLTNVYVRGDDGAMIQLANLVQVEESVAPRELHHFNKMKSVTIQANLAPGVSLDKALEFLEQTVAEVSDRVQIDYAGESREFKSSSSQLEVTFLMALAFIYLVLAAQFESFRAPLIILIAVPPALLGGLFALTSTGASLSVYSQIGLIALVGLISKHGILIVEFANQLQQQGKERIEALVEAATLRLRPILMTTGATVLGVLPLALAEGAGAESRHQIGWVIVGGMLFGTLLTLFVVPTVYSLLGKLGLKPVEPLPQPDRLQRS